MVLSANGLFEASAESLMLLSYAHSPEHYLMYTVKLLTCADLKASATMSAGSLVQPQPH